MSTPTDRTLPHTYDGIEEYDNPMPAWWTAILLVCVLFSFGYFGWYHLGPGRSVADDYAQDAALLSEKRAAERAAAVSDADVATWVADPERVQRGKAKFLAVCAVCHGEHAEGKIGPNLTDDHFLHGPALADLYRTVSAGVAAKGMPAWALVLKPAELEAVVAFVASVRHTRVPGKAPQGAVTTAVTAPALAP